MSLLSIIGKFLSRKNSIKFNSICKRN